MYLNFRYNLKMYPMYLIEVVWRIEEYEGWKIEKSSIFHVFSHFFSFGPLPHLLKTLIKNSYPLENWILGQKVDGYFMSHKCPTNVGHVGHISNVPQNVGHISCFLLKHQRQYPLNISNFYTFTHIFSLFSILI